MRVENISFSSIPQFSKRDQDYQVNPALFQEYIAYQPDEEGLRQAILDRKNFPVNRDLLVSVLRKQYKEYTLSTTQSANIEMLTKENTFTVTCAHQPCLFTGPAYYVYKILSTVKLANNLGKLFPEYHFVPVFINGAEDHDFEEVNHATVFHKTITWETTQVGPVGRYAVDNLGKAIEELQGILGAGEEAKRIIGYFNQALSASSTYSEFTQFFLQQVFNEYGLLVLNMDDVDCKRAFLPYILKELATRNSDALVVQTQEKLAELGYKPQAHARPVNLFYFTEDGNRARVHYDNGTFSITESGESWSASEMLEHASSHPERFSPNVILRPLYQECILPDVAFIGGGGEIAYWMERKTLFQANNLFFPVLIRRDSIFVISQGIQKTMVKLNLEFADFLREEDQIIHQFIQQKELLDDTFSQEKKIIEESWTRLGDYVAGFDHSLKSYMEAEKSKVLKMLDHAEQKLFRAIKQADEVNIQQLKGVKTKLFPGNGLQERVDNYFQFHVMDKENFIDKLLDHIDPLDKTCKVLFV